MRVPWGTKWGLCLALSLCSSLTANFCDIVVARALQDSQLPFEEAMKWGGAFRTVLKIAEESLPKKISPPPPAVARSGPPSFERFQQVMRDNESRDVFYRTMLKVAEDPETLHTIQETRDWNQDDARIVVALPKPEETNIWKRLSPFERRGFVEQLGKHFIESHYNKDLRSNLLVAMDDLSTDVGHTAPVGISPLRALALVGEKNRDGRLMGKCRQYACVAAGILGMMGASREEVRLVSGAVSPNAKTTHIWLEVRFDPAKDWTPVEVTAGGRELEMFESPIEFGQITKQLYRFNEKIHDFLKPVPQSDVNRTLRKLRTDDKKWEERLDSVERLDK